MDLKPLFARIDARPFQPFTIELVSGRLIPVTHPDNIFVLPARQRVSHIEVFEGEDQAVIYPEGIAALHMQQNGPSK